MINPDTTENRILRCLDKADKIGTAGVVDLLQKAPSEFGADLDPFRAMLLGKLIETKGGDNTETISNLRDFMEVVPLAVRRLKFSVFLDSINEGSETMLDRLLAMPTNDDNTWAGGRRPKNIAWALDDIIDCALKAAAPDADDGGAGMRLPFDYARCASGEKCPLAKRCARWLDPGRESYQTFTAFQPGEDCEDFISVNQTEHTPRHPPQ